MIIKRRVTLQLPCQLPAASPGCVWIYILSLGEQKTICKIGTAVDLKRRFNRFAMSGLDYPITFEAAWRVPWQRGTSIATRIESAAHASLYSRRLYGLDDQFLVSPDVAECAVYEAIRKHLGTKSNLVRIP